MLLEDLAKELVEVTSALVSGKIINIMNTSGIIVASSEHERVGSYHQGAMEAVQTGKAVNIRSDQLDRYPGAKAGCNMPLRVNGTIIGVVGIGGDPEEIRDIAHLLEVYAAKYYQMEAMLQPKLAESTLRSRLLTALLSPASTAMSQTHSLLENLKVRFQYPLYTVVISVQNGLGHSGQFEQLRSRLETLSFLKKQWDVWGIVDERLVLVCSELPDRPISDLRSLTEDGCRVSLGMPSPTLWEIQTAYDQALTLDLFSMESFNDIRQNAARCTFMLSHTAAMEEPFLETLYRKLEDCFGPEECRILMESAGAYYAYGRSVTAAAQKLFIHKNTLQYRVRRVLETLELTRLPAFQQEYLVRLLNAHLYRKSRSEGLEK
ncbi:MAG: CdaR family transcriptional regulator [Faecousia sp.]